jgi:hypothetical protein
MYVKQGTKLADDIMSGIHFFPASGVIAKLKSHMMDGQTFQRMLVKLAQVIPGDGHAN